MIKTNITEFENYGRVMHITDGKCEVKVTLDLGPRIIYCGLCGRQNVFFCDIERKTCNKKPEMESFYGKDRFWYLYGGYRLWMSPEYSPQTYYPDNEEVEYVIKGDTVTFIPPLQTENQLQTLFSVTLCGDGKITVSNRMINFSSKKKEGAAWALAAMAKNTYTFALQNDTDTGLLPNRTLVLWPYTKINDKRLTVTDELICVKQSPEADRALKVGFNNEKGAVATLTEDGVLFIQRYKTDHKAGKYPDGGCSCEIYSCPDFTESEALSPLQHILPGHCLDFTVEWELFDTEEKKRDEKTLQSIIEKLI
ncbi:MAG: hypothetical protein IJT49_10535 [Clostridia bacterium]|nr:hypothetical protein [Clostridia bacterium]